LVPTSTSGILPLSARSAAGHARFHRTVRRFGFQSRHKIRRCGPEHNSTVGSWEDYPIRKANRTNSWTETSSVVGFRRVVSMSLRCEPMQPDQSCSPMSVAVWRPFRSLRRTITERLPGVRRNVLVSRAVYTRFRGCCRPLTGGPGRGPRLPAQRQGARRPPTLGVRRRGSPHASVNQAIRFL
jgi:hypothetical protein